MTRPVGVDPTRALLETHPVHAAADFEAVPPDERGDVLQAGLADRMRTRSAALHARAERTGIVHRILTGQADRQSYCLLLRNLLPVYRMLEQELERHRHLPGIAPIAQPDVYRAASLEHDLGKMLGSNAGLRLQLLPESRRLTSHIAGLAQSDGGSRLIAHAYTRFLGDLNGGQVLQRLLARSLGLEATQLTFYQFPAVRDLDTFKRAYRAAFDQAGDAIDTPEIAVEETAVAFELNITLSQAVQDAVIRAPDQIV